ncbi:MAG: glycosyltransferase [Chloroflexota bacterium]
MGHIIFVINDLVSVRNAVIELTQRLQRAGHKVTIASPRQQRTQIEPYHIPYIQLPAPETISDKRTYLQKWRDFHQRRYEAVQALNLDESIALIEQAQPDLIVVEAEIATHVIGLSQLDVPLATLAYFPSIYRGRKLPPLHLAIVPDEGWQGTAFGISVAWWRYNLQRIRGEIRYFLSNAGLYRLSILRHLAKQVGFDFRREVSIFHWMNPVTFTRLPLLSLYALEFDFPHTLRKNVKHLGALVNHNRLNIGRDEAEAQKLERIFQLIDDTSQQRVIYCAFGSLFAGDDSNFIERLLEAVKHRPDWIVIISMGARRDDTYNDIPEHVHIFSWVDQLRILQVADAIVMHAGLGTIMESLYHGVPMLSYPFPVNDQLGEGARIHYHRLGIVGQRDTDSPETIRGYIEQLLNNPLYHENVAKMQDTLANYSPEHTVRVFEDLLESERLIAIR